MLPAPGLEAGGRAASSATITDHSRQSVINIIFTLSTAKIDRLMTDGEYSTQYDAKGISANYGSTTS